MNVAQVGLLVTMNSLIKKFSPWAVSANGHSVIKWLFDLFLPFPLINLPCFRVFNWNKNILTVPGFLFTCVVNFWRELNDTLSGCKFSTLLPL